MTGPTSRTAVLGLALAALLAGPALAQPTGPAKDAQAAAEARKTERAQVADAGAYGVQASEAGRSERQTKARSNSRTAREVWRERHHLPNAK